MAKKKIHYHVGFDVVETKLALARKAYEADDPATSAPYAHEAARLMVNLADDIRYAHGVKAGLAQAKMAQKDKDRKRRRAHGQGL